MTALLPESVNFMFRRLGPASGAIMQVPSGAKIPEIDSRCRTLFPNTREAVLVLRAAYLTVEQFENCNLSTIDQIPLSN